MKTFSLQPAEPTRVDSLLATKLETSRSKIQKAIEDGLVTIDGKTINKKLVISEPTEVAVDVIFFAKPPAPTGEIPELDIIFENDDVIVICKPSGLLVHPNDISNERTLADAILVHDPKIKGVGESNLRPGIVHRLDKDASGVMIIAKNQPAYIHLKKQFKDRLTKKEYTVLVHGKFEKLNDTVNFPISRSKSHGRMAAKSLEQGGKEATTHYTVRTEYQRQSLLDIVIETGRTHQIRVHMFAMDHPVVGDRLYRIKRMKQDDVRLFLHAQRLTIELPDGVTTTFEAKLPKELEEHLATLAV